MKKNKIIFLGKIFLKDKLNSVAFACLGLILFFLMSFSILGIKYVLHTDVENYKELYGGYVFRIETDNTKVFDEIKKESFVKNSIPLYLEMVDMGNSSYTLMETDESFLNISPYEISEGNFPQNENEIAISACYLLKNGISKEDMLGARVSLPFYSDKTYEVTGIVEENNIFNDDGFTYVNCFFCPGERVNSLAIEIDDLSKISYVNEKLTKKYSDMECEVYINPGLVFSIQIDEDKSIYDVYEQILLIIFIFLSCTSVVIVMNFSKLFLHRNRKTLSTLRIIGVSGSLCGGLFLATELILFTAGSLLGLGAAILAINNFLKSYVDIGKIFVSEFPGLMIFAALAINLIIMTVIFLAFFVRMFTMSPNMAEKENGSKSVTNNNRHLFEGTEKRYRFKFAIKDIKSKPFESVLSCIGIVFAGTLLVSAIYYTLQIGVGTENNSEMNYRIQGVRDDGSGMGQEITDKKIIDILNSFSEKVEVVECNEVSGTTKLSLSQLSDSMQEYIMQESHGGMEMCLNGEYEARVLVLGYSEDMLDKLAQANNISIPEGNEAIAYSKNMTISMFRVENRLIVGDVLDVSYIMDGEFNNYENKSFEICGIADTLPVYPDIDFADVILVVSRNAFMEMFPETGAQVYYLKYEGDLSEQDEDRMDLLYMFPELVISTPLEIKLQNEKADEMLNGIVVVVFAVLVGIVVLLLATSLHINAYLREKEYCTMMAIGARASDIFRIIMYRLFMIAGMSTVITLLLSFVITRKMFCDTFNLEYVMFYEYPWSVFALSQAIIVVLFVIISIPIYRNYRKKHCMKVLKCE